MGIAANVNVFALVRSVLFAEPPYRAPAELFQLIPADHMATSPLELADVDGLKQIPGIAQAAACVAPELSSRRTDPTLLVSVTEVSRDFFALYDATPRVGRTLQPADFEPGVRNAVISYELWTVLLGRNPEVVGSRIELSRQSFTVVGVMPQAFAPSCVNSARAARVGRHRVHRQCARAVGVDCRARASRRAAVRGASAARPLRHAPRRGDRPHVVRRHVSATGRCRP
jgi:hypothetical protein